MKALTPKTTQKASPSQPVSQGASSRPVATLSVGMPLVQRQCACGGGCPRCKAKLGIQTKLQISEPGDQYEQEADRVAEQVMRMPVSQPISRLVSQPIAPQLSAQPPQVQRLPAPAAVNPPPQIQASASPLPRSVRDFFEPRFGHDFSQVRIRTDAQSAQDLAARAYTIGQNVTFGAGEYSPNTDSGRRLLAHELTHILQQSRSDSALLQTQPQIQPQIQRQSTEELTQDSPAVPGSPQTASPQLPTAPSPVPIPGDTEPGCPGSTNLGLLEPSPPCPTSDEEIDGSVFLFCSDSDIFKTPDERQRLRSLAQSRLHGSQFKVHAHSSLEGPGTTEQASQHNARLSCHRAKRAAQELIGVGVPEEQIEVAAKGPTDQFGVGSSLRFMNRNVVVGTTAPQPQPSADLPANATLRQIADAARRRLTSGQYNLGADGYLFRWTCGRFRSLTDAVSRTTILVEFADFPTPSNVDRVRAPWEGSESAVGLNTLKLSSDISDDVDPVGCAASRIADLAFHHMSRPQLSSFAAQHAGGLHLTFLAGLPGCQTRADSLFPGRIYAAPTPSDPKAGLQPPCATTPGGSISPQRQPGRLVSAPSFQGMSIVANDGSGALDPVPLGLGNPSVSLEPSRSIIVNASAEGIGDAAALANHEVGLIQTVLSEDSIITYADGGRVKDQLPLPLRDGAPIGDPNHAAPPWFDQGSKVQALPGMAIVDFEDAPNIRAFKVFPNLAQTSFFVSANSGGGQQDLPLTHRGSRRTPSGLVPVQGFAEDSPFNLPDKAHREIHFNTWLVARSTSPPAPLTRLSTQFLAGLRMVFRLDASFVARPISGTSIPDITGTGTWRLSSQPATTADQSTMQLGGAVPGDFRFRDRSGSPMSPLFNEFLVTEPALPRSQAGGLVLQRFSGNDYITEVQRIAQPHRNTAALRGSLTANVRIDMATGRVILDGLDLAGRAITVVGREGNAVPEAEASQLARAIFPEVRKLVLDDSRFPVNSGIQKVSIILRALP